MPTTHFAVPDTRCMHFSDCWGGRTSISQAMHRTIFMMIEFSILVTSETIYDNIEWWMILTFSMIIIIIYITFKVLTQMTPNLIDFNTSISLA